MVVPNNAHVRLLALVVVLAGTDGELGAVLAADCSTDAAVLARDQTELPRLEVASPADRPPYCITLETIVAFAARVKAHVAHCPQSDFAPAAATWDKTRNDYAKLFNRYRCRRTL